MLGFMNVTNLVSAAVIAGFLWGWGYMVGSDGKNTAVAERDLHWIQKLSEQNHELERIRTRARIAADRVPPTPADHAERVRLCEQSATCRKGG